MSLEQQVMAKLKEAMLSKNEVALNALRAIKSAILLQKTSGSNTEISEQTEMQLLQKLLKQRQDALAIYTEQKREDLARKEEEEIALINTFLPKQLSDEEAIAHLEKIIASVGASSIKDMGKVMGLASKDLSGKIDNKRLSELIKSKLS